MALYPGLKRDAWSKSRRTKEINVKFPEDYNSKDFTGKDAMFKVTLHEIQARDIPETPDEEMP